MSGNDNESTPEIDAFMADDEIEVGAPPADGIETIKVEKEAAKPAAKRGPPKPAAAPKDDKAGKDAKEDDDQQNDDADEGGDDDQQDDAGDDDDDQPKPKPKKTAAEHQIERLKREKAELRRELRERDREARLERIEKGGLPNRETGDNSRGQEKPAPDPSDTDKYPLGHLDDRYIEDKLEWLADKKVADQARSDLQRKQEDEQKQAAQERAQKLLDQVDDLSERGSELYPDFQETVVEAGMKGRWDLAQPTFEAAHEVEHGAQILYELSQDRAEASRVAKLSAFQQAKFVDERNAEIAKTAKPRTKPQAGEPPKNTARGANSRSAPRADTDDLGEFAKAWANDAKADSG